MMEKQLQEASSQDITLFVNAKGLLFFLTILLPTTGIFAWFALSIWSGGIAYDLLGHLLLSLLFTACCLLSLYSVWFFLT